MAAYMYTSATGNNWDDDDDNFNIDTYKAIADYLVPTIDDFGLLQHAPGIAEEEDHEIKQFAAPAALKSTDKYDSVPCYQWPSPAQAAAELWSKDEHRRPAYVEMSHDGDSTYSDRRYNYNTNWLSTKVSMCRSMKIPIMMKPSPLQQSMTWEEDSKGEYIKDASLLFASTSSPALSQDSHSEYGQDGPFTPPDSPSMVLVGGWKDRVEEPGRFIETSGCMLIHTDQYDPVTAAIDIPTNFEKLDEVEISHEFVDFNHMSDTLLISDILGDATSKTQHPYYDQTSMQTEMEVGKPQSNSTSGSLTSYTPPDSPSLSKVEEEAMCGNPTASSIAGEDGGRVRRDPMVDLTIVNAMTHNLITIVEATLADHEIGNVNIEEVTTKTLVPVSGAEYWICGDVIDIHNKVFGLIEFVKAAKVTAEVNVTAVETARMAVSDAEIRINHIAEDYNQVQDDNGHRTSTVGDSTSLVRTNSPSPDLEYIHDLSNTSQVWNTVATSWFVLSSLPWGCIAVAAAGALVDLVAFVARR
ncbi:uncharacterized protein EKO05_0008989 [Ascochyta rabiei]|uniref:Uncharacterized protein n=1 Tax=Didymella rabiei TaxID=5454 RepID=A0A163KN25_DIDRA|nr:uncharacterized protein EKO05_0008989 [Ascochyta rabiei]KZM27117.1 hypothetical protein ST47_g1717 [Ascochyta rabiei]UPX18697.1 hypothetical protein EKO05_0008989 [Ascochyta rabiei]